MTDFWRILMPFRKDEGAINGYVQTDRQVRAADNSKDRMRHLEFRGEVARGMTGREMKQAQKDVAKDREANPSGRG